MTDNISLNFDDDNDFSGLADEVKAAMGDSLKEPFIAYIGNPTYRLSGYRGTLSDAVFPIMGYDTDLAGMVWAHLPPPLQSDGGHGESPHFMVLNSGRGAIPKEKIIYGLPIYVVERNGQMMVDGIAGAIGEEFSLGAKPRPQASISISQFDYALLKPTTPQSSRLLVSPSYMVIGNTAYYCASQLTTDISAYKPVSWFKAVGILVELDPVTNTLYYNVGDEFDVELINYQNHIEHFQYYPKTVTAGRVLLGWVRVFGTSSIFYIANILQAQEVIGKESAIPSSTTTILNSVLTDNDGSILVDNNGNIISGG